MKHKTATLEGALLDAAVAKANAEHFSEEDLMLQAKHGFRPSTDWSDGGPIIEREALLLMPARENGWLARTTRDLHHQELGPTPLIAAMRAYCAAKLGDEVDLPLSEDLEGPLVRVPWGAWEIGENGKPGIWHHNPRLLMSAAEQRERNEVNGLDCPGCDGLVATKPLR